MAKRQFPYSTIKSRLYKEYKDKGWSGGWRGDGLKKLTGQVYAEYKLGHLGKHKNAKRIPKKLLIGAAEEIIPGIEVASITPIPSETISYWELFEKFKEYKKLITVEQASTLLIIPNFTDSFFFSQYDYGTHFKPYVDRLNKVKANYEDHKVIIQHFFDIKLNGWVLNVLDEAIEEELAEITGEDDLGTETQEPGGKIPPKKPKPKKEVSDADLEKLNKKERAKALGADKIGNLSMERKNLQIKFDKAEKLYNKERATYRKLNSAKKKDQFDLSLSRADIEKYQNIRDKAGKELDNLDERIKNINKNIK